MAKFKGTYEETFTVDEPIDKAKAHFSSLDSIAASYVDLDKWEKLNENTLRFQLIEKRALGLSFTGKYDCTYEFKEDNLLVWRTVSQGSNVDAHGTAHFTSLGDTKTQIEYQEEIECEIKVNRILGKAVLPIVQRDISQGVKKYLKRMRKNLK